MLLWIRTTPISCTTACAWPTTRITASHEPSTVVPAECIVYARPEAASSFCTWAISLATERVAVPTFVLCERNVQARLAARLTGMRQKST